jgi:hypothetical protein
MTAAPRMVKLAEMWQRKSAKTGKTYFSGFMGDVQLLMFRGEEITRDNGEVVQTWRLLCQERDPERRPQQRREQNDRQPRTAGGAYAPLPRGAATADPGQHDTGDPSRPFDDEVPW